ncbi:MAG: hypothetical protein GY814_20385 [Gammaproteobacteria bacterium]|nr:hypothetical protein [Gammaproteobacteria bacterium]
MANRKVIIGKYVYEETGSRKVIVGRHVYEETLTTTPPAGGTTIIKLAGRGGLAGQGGLAGKHGGLAG